MPSIKTRILIISDTHCAALTKDGDRRVDNAAFRLPLPTADLLIHCGDLTMTGQMDEYHQTLDMLKQIDVPVKIVIAGNHDLSLDSNFVHSHRDGDPQRRQPRGMTEQQAQERWQEARNLWTAEHARARQEGITFLDEGLHLIRLANGASVQVYASPYTPEFYDWGFPYERDQDRYNERSKSFHGARNIAAHPIHPRASDHRPVDIVLTHGPAWLRLDPTTRGDPAGCPHLLQALMRARPLIHCFGHIHEGWGAERVSWTSIDSDYSKMSIKDFKDDGWRQGILTAAGLYDAKQQDVSMHAVYTNVSGSDKSPIRPGEETLFINAAIMDVHYKPANAPWLIDIDLPLYDHE